MWISCWQEHFEALGPERGLDGWPLWTIEHIISMMRFHERSEMRPYDYINPAIGGRDVGSYNASSLVLLFYVL